MAAAMDMRGDARIDGGRGGQRVEGRALARGVMAARVEGEIGRETDTRAGNRQRQDEREHADSERPPAPRPDGAPMPNPEGHRGFMGDARPRVQRPSAKKPARRRRQAASLSTQS